MREKLKRLRDVWRASERVQRRVYMACTVAAIAMSALILVSIAHGERSMAPEPPTASAPDEGETLPLGEGINTAASAAPNAREGTIELTDGEAGALIALALGQKLETEGVTAHFYAPDGVRVAVTVTREALRAFLEREPAGVPPALTALLPDELTLELDMGFSVSAEGHCSLEPRELSALGADITDYLPASFVQSAAEALNSALPERTPLRAAEARDGSAVFTLEL